MLIVERCKVKKMDSNKKRFIRIIVGGVLFAAAAYANINSQVLNLVFFLIPFLIIGGDVILKAAKNITRGKIFDENFLMSIATIGAFFIREYPEGVAVMLFYQVGELFQSYAVDKSRKSITSLMDIRPDYANINREGQTIRVSPEEVMIGDVIVVRPGEKIPLDGTIIEGSSMIDTKALTGESVPRTVGTGDDVLSGCININGLLTAKVTKEYGESTVSKILDLVENAGSKKSNSENFITKFARYYTPIVVFIAILMATLPPIFVPGAEFSDWIYRALTFLVISCPCALVISVPMSFFGGIGAASLNGVLVKGGNYLEALALAETVVFDKTGTLTKGVFKVQSVVPQGISEKELLRLTAYAENYSSHPISMSLKEAYGKEIDGSLVTDVEEIAGHGVIATVDKHKVAVGNNKMAKRFGFSDIDIKGAVGTIVHVIIDSAYCGYIVIADEIKEDAQLAIDTLKKIQVRETVMLTGDAKAIGEKVASLLGLDKVYTELLPGDKVDKLEELMKSKSRKGKLVFVGDGINDAPVLARADLGIAMGGLGSDAAIEAADIVIMTDEPSKISVAMKISKKTLTVVRQNIIFSLVVKFGVLILGAMGIATMWAAVFSDVGVSVLAILNAVRILNKNQYK